jgi:hypothetical protein
VRKPAALAAVALALTVGLALGGCTLVGSSAKPTPTSTLSSALDSLVPTYPAKLTAAVARKNTVTAADAIQALIASTEIVHVDDRSKLVPATTSTGSFYGVERAVTVTSGFDVILQAQAMEKLLVQAGWVSRQTSSSTAGYSVALSTSTTAGASVLLLQADEAPGAAPAILIELESPDLPKK